ncbi:Protein of uncharacterised function (DUF3816) [Mycoplasmopsis maculosa]|uniref:Protein of uncharacterized function (DUF3816) n=1 Tax=Mycoplasmopsis maculosa TaxID=114885 RepID=A0A449B3K0_9BACT|nr:ECF transporter S component [Mycoplasmopsis maculosa]VEU75173.1 Protein of uncharacterised function (DUF3816) [Mycoplasmopsis maculosa]
MNNIYKNINKDKKDSFLEKIRLFFNETFKFSVTNLTLSGILVAFYMIYSAIFKLTILRFIPLELEYIFYIFFGIILGPFKGAVLAIIADTLGLLLTGKIGTWYYLYALIPPAIAILSSLYYSLLNRSKIIKIILPFIVITLATIIILYIFFTQVTYDENNKIIFSTKGISQKVRRDWQNISWFAILALVCLYLFLMLVATILLIIFSFKKKNERILNYLFILSLVTLIVIIFRWVLGPITYISWFNYFYRLNPNKKLKSIGVDYLIYFVPIIIKSLISIPILTLLLTPVFSVIKHILQNQINNNQKIVY